MSVLSTTVGIAITYTALFGLLLLAAAVIVADAVRNGWYAIHIALLVVAIIFFLTIAFGIADLAAR